MQILHNNCFQLLLGITVIQRECENNGYAKYREAERVEGGGGGEGGNQGELWAINVKVASRNRLGVVICFGQRAFITYNFFRRFFVCFVLFYFFNLSNYLWV